MAGTELVLARVLLVMLAHYVADYPLQGTFLGTCKGQYDYLLFCHCVIWTGMCCCMLAYLGIFAWWKLGFLFGGHLVVDRWKARHPNKEKEGLTILLWIDQAIHAGQVVVVAVA